MLTAGSCRRQRTRSSWEPRPFSPSTQPTLLEIARACFSPRASNAQEARADPDWPIPWPNKSNVYKNLARFWPHKEKSQMKTCPPGRRDQWSHRREEGDRLRRCPLTRQKLSPWSIQVFVDVHFQEEEDVSLSFPPVWVPTEVADVSIDPLQSGDWKKGEKLCLHYFCLLLNTLVEHPHVSSGLVSVQAHESKGSHLANKGKKER